MGSPSTSYSSKSQGAPEKPEVGPGRCVCVSYVILLRAVSVSTVGGPFAKTNVSFRYKGYCELLIWVGKTLEQ